MLKRQALIFGVGLLASACAKDVWTYPGSREAEPTVGGDVYRVFCKRQAKDTFPGEMTGLPFDAACNSGDPEQLDEKFRDADSDDEEQQQKIARFRAILERRNVIVKMINRVLGDDMAEVEKIIVRLEEDEITEFLKQMLPLYDGEDPILPGNTRAIAAAIKPLFNEDSGDKNEDPKGEKVTDPTGDKALQAFAGITGRTGYRKLDLALGLIKVVLTYPKLDDLSETGMKFLARGGKGEVALDSISKGLALELASYTEDLAPDSTLRVARDLMNSSVYTPDLNPAETPPAETAIWVTKRDTNGVAVPRLVDGQPANPSAFEFSGMDGDIPMIATDKSGKVKSAPPFKVLNEKGVSREEGTERALDDSGQPLYEYFDANLTMTAAFLQEDERLSTPYPDSKDRTPFEKIGRGLPALFGLSKKHSVQYGKHKVEFNGPDPDTGAIHDLVHGVGALLKHPNEVRRLVEALKIGMRDHEHEMTQLVDTMLKMNELGKEYPDAVLLGETDGTPGGPHRFWDDLIKVAVDMSQRKGMVDAVVKMIKDPKTAEQDGIFQTWMSYKDVATYPNAPLMPDITSTDLYTDPGPEDDLNAEATVKYKTPVDYGAPDIGENRSVWQRTMSMIHHLRNRKQCNKEGAVVRLHLGATQSDATFLPLPLSGSGWKECDLFEVPDMVRVYSQAVINLVPEERAKERGLLINLKPDISVLAALAGVGVNPNGAIQEQESQIHGFSDRPLAPAFARFLFSAPNGFNKGLIDPVVVADGGEIAALEPYGLFAMEVKHPNANNLSFQEAGLPLIQAFENTELVMEKDGNCVNPCKSYTLPKGYMFADLLNVFHMHWGARSDEECSPNLKIDWKNPLKNWSTCTQHLDPKGKWFSYQTNIRSYEPLLAKIFGELKFIHSLQVAANTLDSIQVDGKSGLTILSEFVEVLIKPDAELTYRDGSATAKNNVGEDVGYVSPLYLILDGLKRIDQNFAAMDGGAEAQEDWHQARSDVVDLFLTIEDLDGKKRLKDRVGHKVFLRTLSFIQERIAAHEAAMDTAVWAAGLSERSVNFFDTPLIGGLVELIDKSWEEPAAGRELMRLVVHLVSQQNNPEGYRSTMVAATDLFQLMMDTKRIAPLLNLSAEAVAPGVTNAVKKGEGAPDANQSIVRKGVELLNQVMILHEQRPTTISKVLKNLVADTTEGKTSLETLIDVISEIERVDPSKKPDVSLDYYDFSAAAKSAHYFLTDKAHGIERLYDVIKNRNVKLADSPVPPPAEESSDEGSDEKEKQEK